MATARTLRARARDMARICDRTRFLLVVGLLALGCAPGLAPPAAHRSPLLFPADTFAFANETVWQYDTDPAMGQASWHRRVPRPAFALRCGTVARVTRQFYANARFDPVAPALDTAAYAPLVVVDPASGAG